MKYKKLLSLAVSATIFGVSPSFAGIVSLNHNGIEPSKVIEEARKIDINSIAPNVDITYNILTKNELAKNGGGEVNVVTTSQVCSVNINVDQNFNTGGMGSPWMEEKIGKSSKLSNGNQERIRTEFAILHEASHCNLYNKQDPFIYSDKSIQKALNQFYVLSGMAFDGKKTYGSVYSSLQENYADTLAAMLIIKKYGYTDDVAEVLQKTMGEREELALTFRKYGFDAHGTNFALNEVTSKDVIEFVSKNSIEKISKYAQEIATYNALKSINTYSKADNIINANSMSAGVMSLAVKMLYGKVINTNHTSNINLHLDQNKLYKLAKNVVTKIEANFSTQFKNESDVYKFVNTNGLKIGEISYEEVQKMLEMEKPESLNINDGTLANSEALPLGIMRDYKKIRAELSNPIKIDNSSTINSALKPR